MYIKIDNYMEIDEKIIKEIEDITWSNYVKDGNLVKIDVVHVMLEDLVVKYRRLEEAFEEYRQNVIDNYRRIPVEEQIK